MKRGKHAKQSKISDIHLLMIFIATLFMNVAYAQVSGTLLQISTTVEATAQEGVFITDVISEEGTNAIINNYISTTMDSSILLSTENETKKFTVTIYNKTEKPQVFIGVIKMDGGVGYNNENIQYVLSENIESSITVLGPKEEITFDIILSYKGTEVLPQTLRSLLNFRFKELPKLTLSGTDTISNIYPDYTPQEYTFVVENFDENGNNGVPLTYKLEAEIQKPFIAKIYNENNEEISITTPIAIRGDGIKETHEYKLKIFWNNTNPESGKEYNSIDYANKTYNCNLKLVATPNEIDGVNKYLDYTLNKEEKINVSTMPMYFEIDENEISLEMKYDKVEYVLTVKNNDGRTNTQNYNLNEVKYKLSIAHPDFKIMVNGNEQVDTERILGEGQIINQQHSVEFEMNTVPQTRKEYECDLTIETISPYKKVETIKILITGPTELKPLDEEIEPENIIITDYGLIDVIWLSETTNIISETPNAPDLYTNLESGKALTPVTWTYHEDGITVNEKIVNWEMDTTPKSTWYNYSAEKGNDGKEDNTTSMWANAKNVDGSYFVWIPRYAYRITYYSDPSYTNVTGYYDGHGMWNAIDRRKKYELDPGIETVEYNGKTYIVHPAFMDDTNKVDAEGNALPDYDRGGWSKDLTGIWVAKYEMSTKNSKYYSEPGVKFANTIKVGNFYQAGISYDTEKESHMLKNSEWGAVAYLAYSQYGRNGHEVSINNTSITGNGEGETLEDGTTIIHEYNTILGAKASTTGNIYGIYDMSGGGWEHVAGYNKLAELVRLTGTNGVNMTKNAKDPETGAYISTKYITAYYNAEKDNLSKQILYNMGKVGDATKEVRTSSSDTYWNEDVSRLVAYTVPYYGRGGSAGYGTAGGIFYSDSTSGGGYGSVTFRISLGK